MGEFSQADCVSDKLVDGQRIDFGESYLTAIYTPGHTIESFSYAIKNMLFTGDALLIRGSGRTDFQGGDSGESWDSISNKLFEFPDDTLIYPSHDYNGARVSTVLEVKQFNPRLSGKTRR